ncbi:MAG: hypothetical protein ACREQV_04715, partial [Candidatus Binatia bacterium]
FSCRKTLLPSGPDRQGVTATPPMVLLELWSRQNPLHRSYARADYRGWFTGRPTLLAALNNPKSSPKFSCAS